MPKRPRTEDFLDWLEEEWATKYIDDIKGFLEFVAGCVTKGKTFRTQMIIEDIVMDELEELGDELELIARESLEEMGLGHYWRPVVGRVIRRMLLDEYAGLSPSDIAEDLGISRNSVYYARWLARKIGWRF